MNEVVNVDRQKQRERYDSLQRIAADKVDEVRRKREQLKRELEVIGAGDDTTIGVRVQMASNLIGEYQRQLMLMKLDRTALQAQLEEARSDLRDSTNDKVPDLEVYRLLNSMPAYRELVSRKILHDLDKLRDESTTEAVRNETSAKTPSDAGGDHRKSGDAEHKAIDKIVAEMHAQCFEMLCEAQRYELQHKIRRLESRINATSERLVAFEKEADAKARDAEAVRAELGMRHKCMKADLENIRNELLQGSNRRAGSPQNRTPIRVARYRRG